MAWCILIAHTVAYLWQPVTTNTQPEGYMERCNRIPVHPLPYPCNMHLALSLVPTNKGRLDYCLSTTLSTLHDTVSSGVIFCVFVYMCGGTKLHLRSLIHKYKCVVEEMPIKDHSHTHTHNSSGFSGRWTNSDTAQ